MQIVGKNIPDAPYYQSGKYIPNSNHTLLTSEYVSNVPSGVWSNDGYISFYIENFWEFDHMHYVIEPSGSDAPTITDMHDAEWFRDNDGIIIPLNEGAYQVYMLQHNATHHSRGYEDDVMFFGYFLIDMMPPSGRILVADGKNKTLEQETFVSISGIDEYSGNESMYIDGDIENGDNIRSWVPYDIYQDIVLASGDPGRRFVSVRFRDAAGNESAPYLDSIYFGDIKYFFEPTRDGAIKMTPSKVGQFKNDTEKIMSTNSDNLMKQDGDKYGKFRDYL